MSWPFGARHLFVAVALHALLSRIARSEIKPGIMKEIGEAAVAAADAAQDAMSFTADETSRAASVLSVLGRAKGGIARAAALSPERRREIARKAAIQRWNK